MSAASIREAALVDCAVQRGACHAKLRARIGAPARRASARDGIEPAGAVTLTH
jgi:hypothetical protein